MNAQQSGARITLFRCPVPQVSDLILSRVRRPLFFMEGWKRFLIVSFETLNALVYVIIH